MDPVLGGFAGAALTALVAWVVQLRRLSGDIRTSEAQQLWEQSSRMYDAQAQRNAKLEERQADLERRLAEVERDNNTLRRENIDLASKNAHLEADLAQLRARCDALARENEHLKTLLHERLGGLEDA